MYDDIRKRVRTVSLILKIQRVFAIFVSALSGVMGIALMNTGEHPWQALLFIGLSLFWALSVPRTTNQINELHTKSERMISELEKIDNDRASGKIVDSTTAIERIVKAMKGDNDEQGRSG